MRVVDAIEQISKELKAEYGKKARTYLDEMKETDTHVVFVYKEQIGEGHKNSKKPWILLRWLDVWWKNRKP